MGDAPGAPSYTGPTDVAGLPHGDVGTLVVRAAATDASGGSSGGSNDEVVQQYTGGFQHGHRAGFGAEFRRSAYTYTGEWHADRFHGMGQYMAQKSGSQGRGDSGGTTGPSGAPVSYTGEFQHHMPQGIGKGVYADGSVYVGEWAGGVRHGMGKLTRADGTEYRGEFVRGVPHGYGCTNNPTVRVVLLVCSPIACILRVSLVAQSQCSHAPRPTQNPRPTCPMQ